ncbi:hypothetical protein ASE09_26515 [Streptomyces sp. Root66D1]|nr:hypothetical protein ASD33_29705 [Streptomyces sp. Root1304]KRA97046.1 hypothetical protein ASE09_26515 [Streptomyces sp. Root66D1]
MEMRHRPNTDTDEPEEKEGGRRRIDLSVAQVSGSALAAVIAAKLASTLGVYGTILGAGVISVIATCGGPLFQHLFRRTGEQMRDATAVGRPRARQVPSVPGPPADRTLMLGTVPAPLPVDEEFGAATTHGTRVRGWKRPAVAAALVFGVTMGGITTYELVSGQDFSGTQGTTTFGSVVRGGGSTGQEAPDGDKDPTPAPTGSADGSGADTPGTGGTPTPGDRDSGRDGTADPSPEPTPSGSADSGPTPAPTPTGPTTGPTTEPTAPTGEPTEGTGAPEAPADPADPAPAGAGAGAAAE